MTMIAYHLGPIDSNWEYLQTVEAVAVDLATKEAQYAVGKNDPQFGPDLPLTDFIRDWELAQEMARQAGWEGDFREPPRVFWVPCETAFVYGFAFKQDNNGTTYVMSPVEMPHLKEYV